MVLVCMLAVALAGAAVAEEAWPVLKTYDEARSRRIAMPLGGIGTGSFNLGGRGEIRDIYQTTGQPLADVSWRGERNYKQPFFAIHVGGLPQGFARSTLLLQGPVAIDEYADANGNGVPFGGFPRFAHSSFAAAYPFGEVRLTDPSLPVKVTLRVFNPLVPGDVRASSLPIASLVYRVENVSDEAREVSVCGALRNFIGLEGVNVFWHGEELTGLWNNFNEFRRSADGSLSGVRLATRRPPDSPTWGSLALATPDREVTYRTKTGFNEWHGSILNFWRDFADDGRLGEVEPGPDDMRDPLAAVSVTKTIPAHGVAEFRFLLAWSFRQRRVWGGVPQENHYFREFPDAWQTAERLAPELSALERRTAAFVRTVLSCDYPDSVKDAALSCLAVLRSPTVFRVGTGELMGWEGVMERFGSCHGTCKHVWNYEQALPYLWGELARTQRDVEFVNSMSETGAMLFRTTLPLAVGVPRDTEITAAADGQMGCVQKLYREWRFSGDDAFLRRHWAQAKSALSYAWRKDGWDADQDGVMEGSQHNTMDINYSGPNPEVGFWYLGALRAAAEMATAMNEPAFAAKCRTLAERGAAWMDGNLFNGEYYEQRVYDPSTHRPLAADAPLPNWQIGRGCMADQFVGQVTAYGAGLGCLAQREAVRTSLASIMKYNYLADFGTVFNYFLAYAYAGEAGLVNTTWPRGGEPAQPYPYYAEVWTGIEYAAASAMAWEDRLADAEKVVAAARDRYDGRKRNPFSEIECGYHYVRSLAAWGLLPAWGGFTWDGRNGTMGMNGRDGRYFWANGAAWGLVEIKGGHGRVVAVEGRLPLKTLVLGDRSLPATEVSSEHPFAF